MKNVTRSFILHLDSLAILDKLSDEQAGKLFKSLYIYQKNGEIENLEFALDLALTPFINQFKRDEEKYKKTCERNKHNALKRWENNATRISGKGSDAKHAYNKNDSKNKNKNKNDNNLKKDFEKIYRLYNPDKKIKVIPFEEYKNRFKNALGDVSVGELEENVQAYLDYLKVAVWRKKKDFAAWINSSEFYSNDWKAEKNEQLAKSPEEIAKKQMREDLPEFLKN
jgi:heme-degrading monooxygenase HmoA